VIVVAKYELLGLASGRAAYQEEFRLPRSACSMVGV